MELRILDCGHLDYGTALELQHEILAKVQEGSALDTLMLVEHQPVVTMGRHANNANLLLSEDLLKQAGIDLFHIERGGDATYHGPGQLVGYPICDLKKNHKGSIKQFVHRLEEVFIQLMQTEYNLSVDRNPINAGVWYGESKLVALGLAVQHAVTFHGFAFNINTRLEHFNYIVPCGLVGKSVTSLQQILGAPQDLAAVKQQVGKHFQAVYGYDSLIR
ncbi:MAG: lipoyl(octanoyl) transferase LipB [Spirochaetes bacterium]|nr:lipoyl(octanoyl) transferase LipB [Spirochaetota bacterium]MBU0956298.1 lipoyl(octanoyl) transferase LipB [Spirochaetota bacterium]